MNIIEKKLTEIKPYERNPRKNDNAVEYVANSIREFGFLVPIVIDKEGVIAAGHTRYRAAKKLKMKTVPCVMADELTDEQIRAFRIADNKTAEKAEWDFELLDIELDGIDLDMSEFGFDEDFSIDGMEEVSGYDEKKDERDYFEKTFTFPIEHKKQIISYLSIHQNEIQEEIIRNAGIT